MPVLFCVLFVALLGCCCAILQPTANTTATDTDEDPIIVQTKLGRIRGTVLQSRLGLPFYAFRGIPYGKAPVADRRFRVAVPVDRWPDDEILDATDDGPMCMQYWREYADVSEDCLRLNVYSRRVSVYIYHIQIGTNDM